MEPTQRFSGRVENYARYRPSYPPEALDLLESECGLSPGATVADVGSGTGILSRLLLERGAFVYGVEPNREMREAAQVRERDGRRARLRAVLRVFHPEHDVRVRRGGVVPAAAVRVEEERVLFGLELDRPEGVLFLSARFVEVEQACAVCGQ